MDGTVTAVAGVLVGVLMPMALASCSDPAQQPPVSDAEKAAITRLYDGVKAELAETPQVRQQRAAQRKDSMVHTVAEGTSRTDTEVYSRSADVVNRAEQRLPSGEIRSCGLWTIHHNTGPETVADMCWDVTVEGGEVRSVKPYGTEEIASENRHKMPPAPSGGGDYRAAATERPTAP